MFCVVFYEVVGWFWFYKANLFQQLEEEEKKERIKEENQKAAKKEVI